MKDRLVFGNGIGAEKSVDWWFIYKVKGFSDVYLYFDSEMTGDFIQGNFLRSKYSALGGTFEQFSLPNGGNQWLSYNDHAHFVTKTSGGSNKFYQKGAHEKGFIGWENSGATGVFIQHSLPRFPIFTKDKTTKKTILNPPVDIDLKFNTDAERERMERLFPFFGWNNMFFGRNLMTSYNPRDADRTLIVNSDSAGDRNFVGTGEDEDENENDEDKEPEELEDYSNLMRSETYEYTYTLPMIKQEKTKMATWKEKIKKLNVPTINVQNSNPFGTLYTGGIKPTQHIFCANINGKDTLIKLIEFLSYLSDEGLVSTVKNFDDDDIKAATKKNSGNRPDTDFDGTDVNEPENDEKYQDAIKTLELQLNPNLKTYSKINAAKDNRHDVWASVESITTIEPYLKKVDNMFVSTWKSRGQDFVEDDNKRVIKFSDVVSSLNVKVGGKLQTVSWKSNTNQEHSKVAFLEKPSSKDVWNVCVSGGNLYLWGSKKIKSSLVMCFSHSPLSKAMLKLTQQKPNQVDEVREFSKEKKLVSADLYQNMKLILVKEIEEEDFKLGSGPAFTKELTLQTGHVSLKNSQNLLLGIGSPLKITNYESLPDSPGVVQPKKGEMTNNLFNKSPGWINEPKVWNKIDSESLEVVTDSKTDFWSSTYYGFTFFTGHFYGVKELQGDFSFQVCVEADFKELYDQAGLMVIQDENNWLKAGIEYSDGKPMMGSVLTKLGKSDWATGPYSGTDPSRFWMRITVQNECIRLQYSADDGKTWPLLRLCPFPSISTPQKFSIGVMTCTPQREGLKVKFSQCLLLQPPLQKDLHDLS
eukprot:gene2197-2708_t